MLPTPSLATRSCHGLVSSERYNSTTCHDLSGQSIKVVVVVVLLLLLLLLLVLLTHLPEFAHHWQSTTKIFRPQTSGWSELVRALAPSALFDTSFLLTVRAPQSRLWLCRTLRGRQPRLEHCRAGARPRVARESTAADL